MSKFKAYLYGGSLAKLVLFLAVGAAVFKVSTLLGVIAVVSYAVYFGCALMVEVEAAKEERRQINEFLSQQAKMLGGGTA